MNCRMLRNCPCLQVHEAAGDVWAGAVRPHLHHERGHAQHLPEGGLGQAGILPPQLLLLLVRVSGRGNEDPDNNMISPLKCFLCRILKSLTTILRAKGKIEEYRI